MSTIQKNEKVLQKIQEWLDAVREGNLDRVVGLYAKHAIFHPTLSPVFNSGEDFVRQYHGGDANHPGFTMKKPDGSLVGDVLQVVSSDGKMVASSGNYDFVIAGQVSHARFTFVHEEIDGEMLITTHHSSIVPAGH